MNSENLMVYEIRKCISCKEPITYIVPKKDYSKMPCICSKCHLEEHTKPGKCIICGKLN